MLKIGLELVTSGKFKSSSDRLVLHGRGGGDKLQGSLEKQSGRLVPGPALPSFLPSPLPLYLQLVRISGHQHAQHPSPKTALNGPWVLQMA